MGLLKRYLQIIVLSSDFFFKFTAMHSFISSCPELVTDDVIRRLLPPLECALTLTGQYVTCFVHKVVILPS